MLLSAHDLFGAANEYIFQQDDAPCHTTKKCKKWFSENNTEVLDWPGNSRDLYPIENLWSRLKQAVAAKRPSNRRGCN